MPPKKQPQQKQEDGCSSDNVLASLFALVLMVFFAFGVIGMYTVSKGRLYGSTVYVPYPFSNLVFTAPINTDLGYCSNGTVPCEIQFAAKDVGTLLADDTVLINMHGVISISDPDTGAIPGGPVVSVMKLVVETADPDSKIKRREEAPDLQTRTMYNPVVEKRPNRFNFKRFTDGGQ